MKKESIAIEDGELIYFENFIADPNVFFSIFLKELQWQQGSVKLFGRDIPEPRLTAWYADSGISYKYSNKVMHAQDWHPALYKIKEEIENATQLSFNSVLCNLYRNGTDAMGWHSDAEKVLGKNPSIASVSLGAERKFQLKHRTSGLKKELLLKSGSLLVMAGPLQHHWVHQVPKTSKVTTERINLTFRHIQQ